MNITNIETKQEIYSFWKNIPLIKKVPQEKFEFMKQETRSKIIEILRTGIEDNFSEFTRRYALNAQEIQDILIQNGIKTSVQNTYFHLNILLEEGFIQEIAILKEGRFNKRYYGRTAKLFLFTENYIKGEFDEGKNALLDIINIVNEGRKNIEAEDVIENFLNEKNNIFTDSEDRIFSWFKKNAEKFIEFNVDVKKTYEFLQRLVSQGSHTELEKKIMVLLKI